MNIWNIFKESFFFNDLIGFVEINRVLWEKFRATTFLFHYKLHFLHILNV